MRRLAVLGLLIGACGGEPGVEGGWGAESDFVVVGARPVPSPPPYLHLEGGRYTSLGECTEAGAYQLGPAATGAYELPGTEVAFSPDDPACGPARSFVWTGPRLWLRGRRAGTFEVGYTRE